jgi:endonuclease YncB( thermonuclease family)
MAETKDRKADRQDLMCRLLFRLCLLIVFLPAPLCAGETPALVAAQVQSGDTLIIPDGRVIKLEALHAPLDPASGLAAQAKAALQKAVAGKSLTLDDISADRYGRLSAQVYVQNDKGKPVWLQDEMLRLGLAFLYPPAGKEDHLDDMRAAEAEARHAKRGLWGDPAYADISADDADGKIGRFAFVSGKVLKAERIKNKIYLNFGADGRDDFTAVIPAHDLHNFRKAEIDPLAYEGKTLRLCGWVTRDFGPMMVVSHPGQIEILAPRDARR